MTSLTIVIAGGGTGGHLYPGIAVAREIQRRVPAAHVSFAGTSRGLEVAHRAREGFDLDLIGAAGIKGKSIGARLRARSSSRQDSWMPGGYLGSAVRTS
jgi:UDP-N-acetylglucosamine--N-acetylmuramyl-(pentapeptide) pyrophosphoryl-undecaprenol N-acetylglucosamine transferase